MEYYVKNTKMLKFVENGALIQLRDNQFFSLFEMLFDEMNALNKKFTGERLGLPFERRLGGVDELTQCFV